LKDIKTIHVGNIFPEVNSLHKDGKDDFK